MTRPSLLGLLLVAPALALVAALFLYPLGFSLAAAFTANGEPTLAHFQKAFSLYSTDILFTIFIVVVATILIALVSIIISGALTLGETPWLLAALRMLYRWPLFIPFIVAAQCMRTFLAKNGLMNNSLVALGILDPAATQSFLDWRGIVITFVWKQVPFVTLMLAGAMASIDRSTIEAARNFGASRPRLLFEIVLPQVAQTLLVALILSFVTMLSVLSVPMMVSGPEPTMLTVDMAFRINAYGDYATANALGVISYAMTAVAAWIYLRHSVRQGAGSMMVRAWFVTAGKIAIIGGLVFAIFGPLANLLLWSVAERWYTPFKLPVTYGLRYWEVVFRPTGDAMASLATSIFIALLTVAVALALSVPAGYALARLRLPWRTLIMVIFLLPQAFPSVAIYINVARIFYQIGLAGTIPAVVLVHATHGLVYSVWIAAAAFAAVDRDLELAARNIGASALRTFFTVTLPLAAPGIMASAIFVFLESLDEFTGTFFVGVPQVTTLPLLLYSASMGGNYQIASITALILLVPSVLFMLFIERFLRADVLSKVGR